MWVSRTFQEGLPLDTGAAAQTTTGPQHNTDLEDNIRPNSRTKELLLRDRPSHPGEDSSKDRRGRMYAVVDAKEVLDRSAI